MPAPVAKNVVYPAKIKIIRMDKATGEETPYEVWRRPAPIEFFTDFETVSSINDKFKNPLVQGGQAMIFQIGCTWRDPKTKQWVWRQWTTDRLRESDEAKIIEAWLKEMLKVAKAAGTQLDYCRVIHWSPAEVSFLDSAYNSARRRLHKEGVWPDLPWFDFLGLVVRPAPVTIRGAFNFGLKSIAKAMYAAGLIKTHWTEGATTDGLGAMAGAWWCDDEAERLRCSMKDLALMDNIAAYNKIDCDAMAEIVEWLRANR